MSSLKVGDPVFNHMGLPGVIKKIDQDEQTIIADYDQKESQKAHGRGYHRGMSESVRSDFESVMTEARQKESIEEKVSFLQEKVDSLQTSPSESSRSLAKYLKAELAHMMSHHHYEPRYYNMNEP